MENLLELNNVKCPFCNRDTVIAMPQLNFCGTSMQGRGHCKLCEECFDIEIDFEITRARILPSSEPPIEPETPVEVLGE